ncbi:MAG TPA: FAD-linked oxidase C-terminal domain-containing protein, partial [Kiloniellaceae bacterium]|nr:FAD-linked oxidase C-terminal domain-containing protein [Kiloniellaceae bacterium]
AATGGGLSACELIPGIALDFTLKHIPGSVDPLAARYDWHLLMEATSGRPNSGLRETLEEALATAFEKGRVPDAAIAASESQAKAFWQLREALVEAQGREGASIKHDISVPVSKVPTFLRQAAVAVEALVPGIRPYPFGHLGDGNIHYNLSQPPGMDPADFLAKAPTLHGKVHDIAVALGGAISAEHGIGRAKLAENRRFKSAVELDLMRRVKTAIDPDGLMNPGKLLDL